MTTERILEIFKEILTIPRESGHEELIIAYLQNWAKERNFECKTDEAGNVVIIKPASAGYENAPTVVLQSHSDMVCEKNAGVIGRCMNARIAAKREYMGESDPVPPF